MSTETISKATAPSTSNTENVRSPISGVLTQMSGQTQTHMKLSLVRTTSAVQQVIAGAARAIDAADSVLTSSTLIVNNIEVINSDMATNIKTTRTIVQKHSTNCKV